MNTCAKYLIIQNTSKQNIPNIPNQYKEYFVNCDRPSTAQKILTMSQQDAVTGKGKQNKDFIPAATKLMKEYQT